MITLLSARKFKNFISHEIKNNNTLFIDGILTSKIMYQNNKFIFSFKLDKQNKTKLLHYYLTIKDKLLKHQINLLNLPIINDCLTLELIVIRNQIKTSLMEGQNLLTSSDFKIGDKCQFNLNLNKIWRNIEYPNFIAKLKVIEINRLEKPNDNSD